MCFCKANKNTDIGFYPQNLRIEMCSRLVFLTNPSRDGDNFKLNVLLVDPYYATTQFALFKSSKSFIPDDSDKKLMQDTIVEAFVYTALEDSGDLSVKVLT